MTKQTPATDVTLSPSLAEFLLELVDSYIILLLQAKHREIPLLRAFSRESANSDKRAVHREPSGTKPVPKPLFTGTAAVLHDSPSLVLRGLLILRDFFVLRGPHVPPKPSALTDSRGDIRPPAQRRSRESRRYDTLPSLNADRSVIGRDRVGYIDRDRV
jgi:hypothetical protein